MHQKINQQKKFFFSDIASLRILVPINYTHLLCGQFFWSQRCSPMGNSKGVLQETLHVGNIWDGSKGGSVKMPKLKKTFRHYNSLNWPQNARNHISENLKFKKFYGEGYSRTPLQGTAFSSPYLESPSLKFCVCPRMWRVQMEIWQNKKCCRNTSHSWVFPQIFQVFPTF